MVASYTIPGEHGSIEPGDRLMNLVWYDHVTSVTSIAFPSRGVLRRQASPRRRRARAIPSAWGQ